MTLSEEEFARHRGVMNSFIRDPRRVSILGPSVYISVTDPILRKAGLKRDFAFDSISHLASLEGLIRRDGLGILMIVGHAPPYGFSNEDETWRVPEVLESMDEADTPLIFAPLSLKELQNPATQRMADKFTSIVDITKITEKPRSCVQAGVAAVLHFVEQQSQTSL